MVNKYIGIALLLISLFSSCAKDEIMKIDANERWLYVPAKDKKDTVEVSFQHYLGITDYEVKMPICLMGDYLLEDKKFKVEIDNELTTAKPEDYSVELEQVFHAGTLVDSLHVVLHRTEHLANEKVRVVFHLVPNETFGIAEYIGDREYNTYVPAESATIRVVFSDMISRPSWWNEHVESFYLGEYSDEKYRRFIESSGRTDLEGCSSSDIRKIMQKFRDDIRENGWTEENGKPMEIVMF